MTTANELSYNEMSIQQRATYLMSKGVTAKIDIDPDAMNFGYAAHSVFGKLPCGYHESEQQAVDAGMQWLKLKAGIQDATDSGNKGKANDTP